jgi:hypothetical protein
MIQKQGTSECLSDDGSGSIILVACSNQDESQIWVHRDGDGSTCASKKTPFKNKKTGMCMARGERVSGASSVTYEAIPGDCSGTGSASGAELDYYYYGSPLMISTYSDSHCLKVTDGKAQFAGGSCAPHFRGDGWSILDPNMMARIWGYMLCDR